MTAEPYGRGLFREGKDGIRHVRASRAPTTSKMIRRVRVTPWTNTNTPQAEDDSATTKPSDRLLTPGEVAGMFRVDPKTVTRWAATGRINSIRTPGGHRRFYASEVRALLNSRIDDVSTVEDDSV